MSLLERAGAPTRIDVAGVPVSSAAVDVLASSRSRHRLTSRTPRWRPVTATAIAAVLVIGAGAGIGLADQRGSGRLVVTVDGTPTVVDRSGDLVSDVLRGTGVTVGPGDRVTPALDSTAADVTSIAVERSRSVSVNMDGKSSTVVTTSASVDGLIAQLGVPAASHIAPDRGSGLALSGSLVTIRTPLPVTVRVAGQAQQLQSTAATVGALFADAGIDVGSDDRLSVPAATPVRAGQSYTLVRVDVVDDTTSTVLPAGTRWVRDTALAAGSSRVVTTGQEGQRFQRIVSTYEDGLLVRRRADQVRTTPAIRWVIATGTSTARTTAASRSWIPATGRVDGREPNFAALARCESGGRPRAVSKTGKYRGLYQFDLRTWQARGGVGDPIDATPEEQTYRARLLYADRGRAPWPYCGRFL